MNFRNLSPLFALVTGLVMVSCTPYQEKPAPQPPPKPAVDPAKNKAAPVDDQKLKEERKKKAEEAEKNLNEQDKHGEDGGTGAGSGTAGGTGDAGSGKKPAGEHKEHKEWPFASPVPGKTGFVFSPYNSKVIDVRDIPSGQLVQDPTYPPAEKKCFRVP